MNPLHIVHVAAGLAISIIAVPLILRKVPMNSVYGVRIAKAFSSAANWYSINAYGGKLLLGYGLFLLVFGIAARPFAPDARSIWSLLFVIGPLLAIVPVIALIAAYARRLP
jgi:hypothetical protein